MKHGPHSISELISWHHHGYLEDSTVVRCNNSFSEIIYKLQIWSRRENDDLISFLKAIMVIISFTFIKNWKATIWCQRILLYI